MLATPGLGGARKRKWGKRTKATCTCGIATKAGEPGEHIAPGITRIRGNLCNVHGKYGPCDAGAAAKPRKGRARKPKAAAKPKKTTLTPEQRVAARDAKRAQTQTDTLTKLNIAPDGQAALLALRKGDQPDPAAIARGGFEDAGLVERAGDGSYRLTASGRAALSAAQTDPGRTGDTISAARDRVGARKQRQQAATDRKQQTQARHDAVVTRRAAKKKQPKVDATATPTATTAPHISAAPKRRAMPHAGTSVTPVKATPPAKPAKPQAAPKPDQAATQARNLTAAADATGLGDNLSNLDQFSQGKTIRPQDVDYLVSQGLLEQNNDGTPRQTAQGKALLAAAKRGDTQSARDALSRAHDRAAVKSFTVFKDHTGAHRWIARTTTAYRDRDREILSSAALDADSQRMTATKAFGPLRWWHVGTPDPLSDTHPWGDGLDLGTCDYSVLIGRTRVESGTFFDPVIAEKVARAADGLEMSPGFFHPLDQPDAAGVFSTIRTFERSLVPSRYARASNLFTGFTVKEHSMEIPEMERRFKAMYTELSLTPEQGVELGQQLVATEKAAQAQGIAFKSEALADEITINGVVYKAFPPAKDTAPMVNAVPVAETKAPGDEAMEDPAMEGTPDDMAQDEGEYLGDMSVADFEAMLSNAIAPLVKALDISGKMAGHVEELKGMMGGMQTKEAGVVAEVAALKARLAELEGRQPTTILPDEVEAALKSTGPATPAEPARPDIVNVINDPDRPWAGWGATTFPELYQNRQS